MRKPPFCRTNISITVKLKEAMDAHAKPLNWSAIAEEALWSALRGEEITELREENCRLRTMLAIIEKIVKEESSE